MSTDPNIINQILNRLSHLDKGKGKDLNELKKITLTSTKDEIKASLDQLNLKEVIDMFKELLKSDEKFIYEDVQDIFNNIHQTLDDEEFYERFNNVIRDDVLVSDSPKLKSIHLRLLLKCCKNSKVQDHLVNNLLSLIIVNLGAKEEEVGTASTEILIYLSVKNEIFLDNYLFNQSNYNQLNLVKNKNEVVMLRYFEFLIDLALTKQTYLHNQHIQNGIKELLDLSTKSDDPLIIRNCLMVLNSLIENEQAVQFLSTTGYFDFIASKICNSESELFINLLMPGYLDTFAKMGASVPVLIENYSNVINQIIEFISTDNFTSQSIESIGLIGRLGKGKLILNSNLRFVERCLPRLGQLLKSNDQVKVEVLNCLSSLFDLNDQDATVEISNLLKDWYSKLMGDRKLLTQSIFILCKQVFPEIHLNALNLIRILCKHSWGQAEFAQLNTFLDYVLNTATETDYQGKQFKYRLVQELATSPFTSSNFGGINHAKIRKVYQQGELYVEQDVSVAVEGL